MDATTSVTLTREALASSVRLTMPSSSMVSPAELLPPSQPRNAIEKKPEAPADKLLFCSFCGKSHHEVKQLIAARMYSSVKNDVCVEIQDEEGPVFKERPENI